VKAVRHSVWVSVKGSMRDSVWNSVWDSMPVWVSVRDSMIHSGNSVDFSFDESR